MTRPARRRAHRVSGLLRALAVIGAATAAALGASQPAAAAEFGMSDGRPQLFDSPHLHALDFQHVRLVLPWDAARRDGTWMEWLDRARLQGWQVMVSPTIDAAHDCGTGSCTGPAPADYEAALRELLARAPAITSVEAWNEPNHSLQPTSRSPILAANYFEAARAACDGRCTAVAGNMLDGTGLTSYLRQYRAALKSKPAVWGLHDYFDATYFQRSGLDQILAITDGPVWLTETGGLVTFRSDTGTLPYDEARAADSLRWIFTMAKQNPQIKRAYLYGMWQQPWNPFDSALLRVDGTERESMQVARAYIGKRKVKLDGEQAPNLDDPAIAAAAVDPVDAVAPGGISRAGSSGGSAAGSAASGRLYLVGKRPRMGRGREVAVGIRCVGSRGCTGRLRLGAGRWHDGRAIKLEPFATKTLRIRLPKAIAAKVNLRLPISRAAWLTVCDATATCGPADRVKLRRD